MNPEFQKQLAGLVEDARKAGVSIFDYIQTHAPAFAKQILDWYYYDTIFDLAIGIFCALVCLGFSIFFFARCRKKWDHDGFIAGLLVSGILLFISIISGVCPNVRYLIKLRVAPQLVLVQQIQRFL